MKKYYVYIMASRSRSLYIGVTGNLPNRILQHKSGEGSRFARRYRINQLVFVEEADRAQDAIAREKQLKRFTRAKKLALIQAQNPRWADLAKDWSAAAHS